MNATGRNEEQPSYRDYMLSDAWRAKRREVWARAGGVCERCGERRIQEVHHKTYERFGAELLEDLEGLCSPCHQAEHGKKPRRGPSKKERRRRREALERDGYPEPTEKEARRNQELLSYRTKKRAARIDRRHRRKKFGEF